MVVNSCICIKLSQDACDRSSHKNHFIYSQEPQKANSLEDSVSEDEEVEEVEDEERPKKKKKDKKKKRSQFIDDAAQEDEDVSSSFLIQFLPKSTPKLTIASYPQPNRTVR